jgi:hypothetical protein
MFTPHDKQEMLKRKDIKIDVKVKPPIAQVKPK